MSEKKTEIDDETKPEENAEAEDDKKPKAKSKREAASKKAKNNTVEENSENTEETSPSEEGSTQSTKKGRGRKSGKKPSKYVVEDSENERKIPLLDQPAIIEGTRSRKCIQKPEPVEVKAGSIVIPEGKGKPLGKIPLVNSRLSRLRITTLKALHRFMYGRIGNASLLISNIQKFRGFPFSEDSDIYSRKLAVLHKHPMNDIKELMFTFDLDMKRKKKDESIKDILNFLILPKESEKVNNPSTINHPKRKATKRNYFDADVDEDESKKRKKAKHAKESKKEEKDSDEKENKITKKTAKMNERSSRNNETSKKDEDQDNNSELKKPAKKRKRNQVIEEEETDKSNTEIKQDEKEDDAEAQDEENEAGNAAEEDSESSKKSDGSKDMLSDEELRDFLKKVLADLNLESTTMKTVYNLISSEYPTYDFSKKKRFIKGVVKSLIQ